jgi:hypothetical protein
LVVLTISDDRKKSDIIRIVTSLDTSLPVLLDTRSKTLSAYRVRTPPTLYLIDQEQKVHRVWIGSIEKRKSEVIGAIRTLLKSPAPAMH